MAVYQFHEGGKDPSILGPQSAAKGQGLPACDTSITPAVYNTLPWKHIKRCIMPDQFSDGCICTDDLTLAVGDVLTLGIIPGGSTLAHVQWDVCKADPTFEFDLEIRKVANLTAAGTVVEAGLGKVVADGAENPNVYFSKYGVATCPGKDCYGNANNAAGFDHGALVAVVKALPTGAAAGCNAKKSVFGSAEFCVSYIVSDLR